MITFAGTLLMGAVAGWLLEHTFGARLMRWGRQKRMQMRALRRRGESPLRAWLADED